MTYLRMIERFALVSLFLMMAGLFFLGVVAREIGGSFASGFSWIEEAVRLMNIFLVFLGLGLALERGKHVGMDSLRDRLPEALRRGVLKVIDATGFVFAVYMAWLGGQLAMFVINTGQKSPTLGVPMGYIYLAPVIGFLLLALRFALSFLGKIDRFRAADQPQAGRLP